MSDTEGGAVADTSIAWGQIRPRIELLLTEIFSATNNILQAHAKFGFSQIAQRVNPSIEDTLVTLKLVEAVLDTLDAVGVLDYDESRRVLNAKQQIWNVHNIAISLKNSNEKDYLDAIGRLDKQVDF